MFQAVELIGNQPQKRGLLLMIIWIIFIAIALWNLPSNSLTTHGMPNLESTHHEIAVTVHHPEFPAKFCILQEAFATTDGYKFCDGSRQERGTLYTRAAVMACKKLLNDPLACVDEMLVGFVAANPAVKISPECRKVVVRSDIAEYRQCGKVAVVSGGGSGHEPLFAGYVGKGGLAASAAGAVFASPPPAWVLAAIRAVHNPGTLVVIVNYTGDRLNLGLATERAKADFGHIGPVDSIVVGEDTALESLDKTAGRRGMSGVAFIVKLAGALAEEGKPLHEIVFVLKSCLKHMGTIGLSLSSCSLPGASDSIFHLKAGEMELGLGVHGEPGVKRVSMTTAKDTVDMMLKHMTNPESETRLELRKGDEIAIILNNYCATTNIEMNILCAEIIRWFDGRGIVISRMFIGHVFTSLEMHGITITALLVNEEIKRLLDAECGWMAWPCKRYPSDFTAHTLENLILQDERPDLVKVKLQRTRGTSLSENDQTLFKNCILSVCDALTKNSERINALDRIAGDGDCGSTLRRGGDAIRNELNSNRLATVSPSNTLQAIGQLFEDSTGGTTGPVYSLLLTSGVDLLEEQLTPEYCVKALEKGIENVRKYGGAQPNDRTMVDALLGALAATKETKLNSFAEFASACARGARTGADSTSKMTARAGRASCVAKNRVSGNDPGAEGVAVWMGAIADFISNNNQA